VYVSISIRKWWCVLALITVVLSCSAIALADAVTDAQKAIQAQYTRLNAATMKRDTAGIFAIYSADFVGVDVKGKKHSIADLRQQTQILFNQARIITGTSKVQSVTLKGATALVRVAEHSKLIGTDPQTRTDATIVMDTTCDDVWVFVNRNWILTKSKTRTAKSSLNGRPFE
jgi:ketosteroid isomerase-like protein